MKKPLKRIDKIGLSVLLVIIFVIIVLTASVKLIHTDKHLRFFSETQNDEYSLISDDIIAKMSKSELFYDDFKGDVVFFNNSWGYSVASKMMKSFGITYSVFHKSLINRSDPSVNTVFSGSDERALVDVVAHELVHQLIYNEFGFIKERFLISPWKQEGYAEYIAGSGSFDEIQGLEILCSEDTQPNSGSFSYFLYRIAITHLLDNSNLSIRDVFEQDIELEDTLNQVRQQRCNLSVS